jgi:hypothetical protein
MDRLKKKQKEALITWIAEGIETDEVNKRAAKFKPAFKVSSRVVTHYRKSREIDLQKIKEESESDALKSGLALRENRVELLKKLGDKFSDELLREDDNKLWLLQVKGIGGQDNFERIEYYDFNRAEVETLRGVLDDIAAEVGDRVRRSDITTNGKDLPMATLTPEQIMEKISQVVEAAKQRKKKEDAG